MKRFITALVIGVFFSTILIYSTMAADAGKYQAFALPKSATEVGDRVMILDTSTGDLWQFWEAPAMGAVHGVDGITYLGKVMPGNTPGETHTYERFNSKKPN